MLKEQVICNFGFKINTDPYKTCKKCRKQPTTDNNHPGSSSDHLTVVDVIETPLIEPDDIKKNDIPKNTEIFNNGPDKMCMPKLLSIFSEFGYNVRSVTPRIIEIVFFALDDPGYARIFIRTMVQEKYAGLSECDDGSVNLLFAPDDKTVYFMNLKNVDLIDNSVSKVKYKNKRRCQICFEKQSKHFKICSQCNKEYCKECFVKANQLYFCCPFCRYTMNIHIGNNIKNITKI